MGKRELLLISAFLVVGLLAWRLTAPPAEPGAKGFSLQRMVESIRSELQSHDTRAEVAAHTTAVVSDTVGTIEVDEFSGPVVIEGVEGDALEASLRGTVFGADEAQASAFAAATTVRVEAGADTLHLTFDRPEMKRSPRLELTVRVPRRVSVKATTRGGRLEARNLGGLEFESRRATVLIAAVSGLVKGNQRDNDLEIADVGRLELSTRRVDARIERVAGSVKGEADDGQWLVRDVGGAVTLESERADLSLERLGGGLDFNTSDGYLTVRDEVGDVRGESRRCRLTFRIAGPGTLDVTSEDATVELEVDPAAGARLDLRAEDATVRAPEGTLRIDSRDAVTEALGTVGSGGRLFKVRSRRGDITVRP